MLNYYDVGTRVSISEDGKDAETFTIIKVRNIMERVDDYHGHLDHYKHKYIEYTAVNFNKIVSEGPTFTGSETKNYDIIGWKSTDDDISVTEL